MRTAVTVAQKHSGEEVLVAGRKVPLQKQWADFRAVRGMQSHPEFASVTYQESDGHLLTVHLRSPKAQEEHDARRAGEIKSAKEIADRETASRNKAIEDNEKRRQKEHDDYIAAHNAGISTAEAARRATVAAAAEDAAKKKKPEGGKGKAEEQKPEKAKEPKTEKSSEKSETAGTAEPEKK